MRTRLMPLLTLLLLFGELTHAQGSGTAFDCVSPTSGALTFTSATPQSPSISNSNAQTPCVSWRVTYNSTGFSGLSIQIETSPDDSTWTAVPNTGCSSSVQPPCVIDGANPTTTTTNATFSVRAYGRYVRVNVTSATGSGTISVRVYGYKGLSANLGAAGSGGGGGGPTSNQNLRTPGAYFALSNATTVCNNIAYSGTITGIKLLSDATVTATVDVKTVAFGSFTGPGSTSSITGGSPATITAGTNATPSISGWSTSVSTNTVACYAPSGITAGSATYLIAQLQIAAN